MVKKRRETPNGNEPATVKLPAPLSDLERLQAAMVAAGFSPDQFNLRAAKIKTNGQGGGTLEGEMTFNLPPEATERLIKLLTVKPFDPDKDTVTFANAEFSLLSVNHESPESKPAKLWTGKERGKRSKTKSDVPEV